MKDEVEKEFTSYMKAEKRRRIIILCLCPVIVLAGAYCYVTHGNIQGIENKGDFSFQDGDIIFQSCASRLCEVIEGVTQSPYSHAGMVAIHDKTYGVIEAFGPVGEVPLKQFIKRGKGRFTLMRLKGDLHAAINKIKVKMKEYYGRPYDASYTWDNKKIYCTELIYKAAHAATGIRLAPFAKLGDMNYKPFAEFIHNVEGFLPLEREMITPRDLRYSDYLELVYTNMED